MVQDNLEWMGDEIFWWWRRSHAAVCEIADCFAIAMHARWIHREMGPKQRLGAALQASVVAAGNLKDRESRAGGGRPADSIWPFSLRTRIGNRSRVSPELPKWMRTPGLGTGRERLLSYRHENRTGHAWQEAGHVAESVTMTWLHQITEKSDSGLSCLGIED